MMKLKADTLADDEAEIEALTNPLGALLPALDNIKSVKAKVKAGTATAEDKASVTASADTAKAAKAELLASTPGKLRALKDFAAERETKRIIALMRQSQEIDLCFVLDATGSMHDVIAAVCRNIRGIVRRIERSCPHLKLRLGLVGYRDLEDGADHFAVTDFSTSVQAFEAALASLTAKGGADQCEDVVGGLDQATRSLSWRQQTKVLMLCADAPCHGSEYHNGCGDNHPGGVPGMPAKPVLQRLQQLGADCTFMRMNSTTDKMVAKFNEQAGFQQQLFRTAPLDTADLKRSTAAIIGRSVSESISKSASGAKATRCDAGPVMDKIIEEAEKAEEAEEAEGRASAGGGGGGVGGRRRSPWRSRSPAWPAADGDAATAESSAPARPPSAAAAKMDLSGWFERLRKDGAVEAMTAVGVEEPADLLEAAADEVDEIVAVLPRLKARQFKAFLAARAA